MKKLFIIFGTRPEMIKLSPIIVSFRKKFIIKLIHTGQHFSKTMSENIYRDLKLGRLDYHLINGKKGQGGQTAKMLEGIEKLLITECPHAVIVQGDTNSTLAGALAAAKLNIPVIHIEAGARSGNKAAPEELNRIIIDHIAKVNFAIDNESLKNLRKEGLIENVYQFHNTAYEACRNNLQFALRRSMIPLPDVSPYLLFTVHRAETTHYPEKIKKVVELLKWLSKRHIVLFPLHPGTKKILGPVLKSLPANVRIVPPLGYLDFLKALSQAHAVISDSGGLVDECVALNVPLAILRNETERNEIIKMGKATLLKIGLPSKSIIKEAQLFLRATNLQRMRKIKTKIDWNVSKKMCAIVERFV